MNFVVFGASRGLGDAFVKGLPEKGDHVWMVSHYDFEKDDPEEIANIIHVNTTSAILCTQKLLPNLKKSKKAKVFLIGSTDGIENNGSQQVSYVASKFGVRGVASALRESLRKYEIGVTCINPGNIASTVPYEEGAEKAISLYKGTSIPVQDIVSLVKTIAHLSKASCVKEINMPAMMDRNA
jgi:short-subunit dehydrogenase